MMLLGPMTMIILLVLVAAMLAGLALLIRGVMLSSRCGDGVDQDICPRCGRLNTEAARFCAHCGLSLKRKSN